MKNKKQWSSPSVVRHGLRLLHHRPARPPPRLPLPLPLFGVALPEPVASCGARRCSDAPFAPPPPPPPPEFCLKRGGGGAALEAKGPQRWPQRRLGRRLEEVAKAVGGGYCRLQMPLRLALGVRGTAAGHRLGALEGGGGGSPLPMHPSGGGGVPRGTPPPPQETLSCWRRRRNLLAQTDLRRRRHRNFLIVRGPGEKFGPIT